jgi:hypothetical protein
MMCCKAPEQLLNHLLCSIHGLIGEWTSELVYSTYNFGSIGFVFVGRTKKMISAIDPKDVLHVVADPEFEHSRDLRAEVIIKRLGNCEVKYRSLQLETASNFPTGLHRPCFFFSSGYQLQAFLVQRQNPYRKARSCVIN